MHSLADRLNSQQAQHECAEKKKRKGKKRKTNFKDILWIRTAEVEVIEGSSAKKVKYYHSDNCRKASVSYSPKKTFETKFKETINKFEKFERNKEKGKANLKIVYHMILYNFKAL